MYILIYFKKLNTIIGKISNNLEARKINKNKENFSNKLYFLQVYINNIYYYKSKYI